MGSGGAGVGKKWLFTCQSPFTGLPRPAAIANEAESTGGSLCSGRAPRKEGSEEETSVWAAQLDALSLCVARLWRPAPITALGLRPRRAKREGGVSSAASRGSGQRAAEEAQVRLEELWETITLAERKGSGVSETWDAGGLDSSPTLATDLGKRHGGYVYTAVGAPGPHCMMWA